MKMVTKTFERTADCGLLWTERLINDQLRGAYFCEIDSFNTTIYRDEELMAECDTPQNLLDAMWGKKPITFSVTLPARYWK